MAIILTDPAHNRKIGSSHVESTAAPVPATPLQVYLDTLKPMQRGKARVSLEMQVRVNGGEFMLRHRLVECRVAAGAKVIDQRGDMVLMNLDGSFMDARSVTKHGMNYAAWLSVRPAARTAHI